MDELLQAGRIAIFEQFAKFDPDKGKFSTYIMSFMAGKMRSVLSDLNKTSMHYYSVNRKIEQAEEELRNEGFSAPTIRQIAERIGIPEVTIQHAFSSANISATTYIEDLAPNERAFCKDNIQSMVEDKIISETVSNAVSRLSKLHRIVIAFSFGMAEFDGCYYGKQYSDSEICAFLRERRYDEHASVAKVKKIKAEAIEAFKRDKSLIDLSGGKLQQRSSLLEDFTLDFKPEALECENHKPDTLEKDEFDFDFTAEFVSSMQPPEENIKLELVSELVSDEENETPVAAAAPVSVITSNELEVSDSDDEEFTVYELKTIDLVDETVQSDMYEEPNDAKAEPQISA